VQVVNKMYDTSPCLLSTLLLAVVCTGDVVVCCFTADVWAGNTWAGELSFSDDGDVSDVDTFLSVLADLLTGVLSETKHIRCFNEQFLGDIQIPTWISFYIVMDQNLSIVSGRTKTLHILFKAFTREPNWTQLLRLQLWQYFGKIKITIKAVAFSDHIFLFGK